MKKIVRKITVMLLALLITVPAITTGVSAASSVTINSNDNIKGGEVFTVKVTFDGDSIGRVCADITYDTDTMAYLSGGSSSGDVGYVELKTAGIGEPLVFNLKFQALKEGKAKLDVSTSEMYDLNENLMDTPSASKTINILSNADNKVVIQDVTESYEDDAVEEVQGVDEKVEVTAEDNDYDEKEELTEIITESSDEIVPSDDQGFSLAKAFTFGIAGLILVLIVVLFVKRKK